MAFDHPRTEVRLTLRWSKGDSNPRSQLRGYAQFALELAPPSRKPPTAGFPYWGEPRLPFNSGVNSIA